jgi:hypothetical protein
MVHWWVMNRVVSVRSKARIVAILALLGIFGAPGGALAGSLSTNCTIGVDTALSLTLNSDINFGKVKAGTADTYTISTAGAVSHAGSGAELYGSTSAGSVTIVGSTSRTINISVGSYTANNGVTPQSATCNYNGGGSGTCALSGAAAAGAGKTLLLGVQAVVDGTQTAGTSAAPTFVVTVVYP